MDTIYLGIEGGGSKSRGAVLRQGRVLARIQWEGMNPGDIGYREFERRLRALVRPLLAGQAAGSGAGPGSRRFEVSACLALAGVGRAAVKRKCEAIAARVIGRYAACRRLVLMTDADALVRTHLGRRDGVVLIAGTGSIAVAVKHRARRAAVAAGEARTARARAMDGDALVVRVGGLGGLSDAGSGFKIGMGLVEHALRVLEGSQPRGVAVRLLCRRRSISLEEVPGVFLPPVRSQVAPLAPIVLEACRAGDPAARSIIRGAVSDLVELAVRAKEQAGLQDRVQVYLSGGLFASSAFRRMFRTHLRRRSLHAVARLAADPLACALKLASGDPAAGCPATAAACRPLSVPCRQ